MLDAWIIDALRQVEERRRYDRPGLEVPLAEYPYPLERPVEREDDRHPEGEDSYVIVIDLV